MDVNGDEIVSHADLTAHVDHLAAHGDLAGDYGFDEDSAGDGSGGATADEIFSDDDLFHDFQFAESEGSFSRGGNGSGCGLGSGSASGSGSGSVAVAEGTPIGTNLYTVAVPGEGGPYTFAITGGNESRSFAIDEDGDISVAGLLSVDADELHALTITVSSSCGSHDVDVDITVLPVLIDVYPDKSEDSFSFTLDHLDATDTSLTSHWILPQCYRIEVTLPDVASP